MNEFVSIFIPQWQVTKFSLLNILCTRSEAKRKEMEINTTSWLQHSACIITPLQHIISFRSNIQFICVTECCLFIIYFLLFISFSSASASASIRFLSRIKISDSSFSSFIVIFALLSQLVHIHRLYLYRYMPYEVRHSQRHVMCNLTRANQSVKWIFRSSHLPFPTFRSHNNQMNACDESNERQKKKQFGLNHSRYFSGPASLSIFLSPSSPCLSFVHSIPRALTHLHICKYAQRILSNQNRKVCAIQQKARQSLSFDGVGVVSVAPEKM